MKKQLKNKKILYLYTGNHSVHRKFAEAIGADIEKMSWHPSSGYNIYLSEGDYFKLSALKIIGKLKNKKIFVLFSDPRLYYLTVRKKLNLSSNKVCKINEIGAIISKFLIRKLDGAICLSEFETSLLKKIAPALPVLTHYPFIEEKLFKQLQKVNPSLKERKVLFIGNGPDWYYKGLDKITELAKKNHSIKFIVVGGNWEEFLRNKVLPGNLVFAGLKTPTQLIKYLIGADLYLHLGRGEAFGVSISEAMLAGLPCIISTETGAKELAEKVAPGLIVKDDSDNANKKVRAYFSMSKGAKRKLSISFKKVASKLEEKRVLGEYKVKFDNFLEKI